MKKYIPGSKAGRQAPLLLAATALAGFSLAALTLPAYAATPAFTAKTPIKIGVIGEESSVAGGSITKAAILAADQINAAGGVDGHMVKIFTYDDHSSASDAVRAFQRAAGQDHVNGIIVSYISEVALAVEPWAARLHMVTITPGAATTKITKFVHDDYNKYKYMFHGWINSDLVAQTACSAMDQILFKPYHMTTAVTMSEDAAWTLPLDKEFAKCLPKVGIKVLDQIRFNPDTTDFTPIFNKIEAMHPSVIMTGISHVGVQPTVQWHNMQVPIPMAGESYQATTSSFWKDTNGAADGVITATAGAPGVAVTPKSIPFIESYTKMYGVSPSYAGFASFDDVHIIANAVVRAKSLDPAKIVTAMEKTDYLGVMGRVRFYGKNSPFTHGIEVKPGLLTGIVIQWQNGKQVCVWPTDLCHGKLEFPAFVKLAAPAAQNG
ncbi:MAG TPA: ABC transporter substrate-binding protein [Acidiphilium sp.]